MILLKNAKVFAPRHLGKRDVLLAGGKIIAVEEEIRPSGLPFLKELDVQGKWVTPGFIDSHIHIAGAGGEGGPATRTRDLTFEEILAGGITTVIGCLGTDGITRSVASVLMKVKELRQKGMSAWMYTGAYQVPPPTVMGAVEKDIAFLDEVIGVGEIAINDHRSSYPTLESFVKVIQDAKVAGLLGKKAGIVNVHLGDNGEPFQLIYEAAGLDGINFNQFLPTHCNRSRNVFEAAKKYAGHGIVDLTTSSYPYFKDIEIKPSDGFFELLEAGVEAKHITFSTDSGGSLPQFDDDGNCKKISYGKPESLFHEVLDILHRDETQAEKAFQAVTSNVADILKLESKGHLKGGYDADLLVLNQDNTGIEYLFANGKLMIGEHG